MPAWARILIIVVCVAAVGSMHLIAWIAYSTRSHEPYFPPRHVITPAIAFDGQGNQITAYQIEAGDSPATYLQKVSPNGDFLWGDAGVELQDVQPQLQNRRPRATALCLGDPKARNSARSWIMSADAGAVRVTARQRRYRQSIADNALVTALSGNIVPVSLS
jgi:hypothetical protein